MVIANPYRQHVNSSENLVTTYEAIRSGFVALALEFVGYNAVITSPPYCNRYDYAGTYAIELALLR